MAFQPPGSPFLSAKPAFHCILKKVTNYTFGLKYFRIELRGGFRNHRHGFPDIPETLPVINAKEAYRILQYQEA